MATEKGFRLKLTGEGMNLDRAVAPDIAQHIVALVLGGSAPAGSELQSALRPPGSGTDRATLSVREFLEQSQAKRIPEQIATIGLYLKTHNNAAVFSRKDLIKGFEDAQEPVPKNLPRDAAWAVKIGWIAPKSGQKNSYYLTGTGEAAVRAKFPAEVRKKTKQNVSARRRRKKRGKTEAAK
jgi:hypothetical protein